MLGILIGFLVGALPVIMLNGSAADGAAIIICGGLCAIVGYHIENCKLV